MLAMVAVRLRGCRWRRLQQGCVCNRRKIGSGVHDYCREGKQRYGVRDGCCHVQFVAGRDQDSWQRTIVTGCDVNRLQRKIAVGSFLPQGSLLAAIKEDGSERLLLTAFSKRHGFWSFYQIYDVDTEDGSRLMDLRLGGRQWMKATSKAIAGITWKMKETSKAIVGIAWKMKAAEMATRQEKHRSDIR
ncbi:hypothetical protein BHM03_00015603 [Ensete ventricosum]|uniref:Uncharacterized protein n=1 Tax=Ensete ventricosum TaxID=4639 RepID=A0A445MEI5_ENSVE|nr:hypothetical protein BHM03_00015603 [Ensete ventricosum]